MLALQNVYQTNREGITSERTTIRLLQEDNGFVVQETKQIRNYSNTIRIIIANLAIVIANNNRNEKKKNRNL